jgi:hypothetical protein
MVSEIAGRNKKTLRQRLCMMKRSYDFFAILTIGVATTLTLVLLQLIIATY